MQFDVGIVDICFRLLDIGEGYQQDKDQTQRKNPIYICRTVAAMVRREASSSDPSRLELNTDRKLVYFPFLENYSPKNKLAQGCYKQHLLPISSIS